MHSPQKDIRIVCINYLHSKSFQNLEIMVTKIVVIIIVGEVKICINNHLNKYPKLTLHERAL